MKEYPCLKSPPEAVFQFCIKVHDIFANIVNFLYRYVLPRKIIISSLRYPSLYGTLVLSVSSSLPIFERAYRE